MGGRGSRRGARVVVPRSAIRRTGIAVVLLGVCLASGGPRLDASVHEFTLDIPNRRRVAFELELPVEYPGQLVVDATWSGARVMSFKLEGPGDPPARLRRSGPSPQRIVLDVDPSDPETPEIYVLSILSLPATGEGEGVLRIELPDHPAVVAAREEALRPPEPPPPEPEPWMVAVAAPSDAPPDREALYRSIETLRRLVVLEESWEVAADPCRWQEDTLRYLVEWRDRIAETGELPSIATRRFYGELWDAAWEIEQLRTSDDPIVAGPPPETWSLRRAWNHLHKEKVEPLERKLDRLLAMLRDGFVPEHEDDEWPQRLVTCMTACERHFEESSRLGPDRAANAELAARQWWTILSAARALEAIAELSAVTGEAAASGARPDSPPAGEGTAPSP